MRASINPPLQVLVFLFPYRLKVDLPSVDLDLPILGATIAQTFKTGYPLRCL